jgi:hypothetical protein
MQKASDVSLQMRLRVSCCRGSLSNRDCEEFTISVDARIRLDRQDAYGHGRHLSRGCWDTAGGRKLDDFDPVVAKYLDDVN